MSKPSLSYICRFHPHEEIETWVNSLKYFYFLRGSGGHTIDGDKFIVEIGYSSLEEVRAILQVFSISFFSDRETSASNDRTSSDNEKTEVMDDYLDLRYKYIEKNEGVGKFVKFKKGKCTLEIFNSGNHFHTVFENHFQQCLSLEERIEKSGLEVLRTIEYDNNCVSRRSFPEFFTHDFWKLSEKRVPALQAFKKGRYIIGQGKMDPAVEEKFNLLKKKTYDFIESIQDVFYAEDFEKNNRSNETGWDLVFGSYNLNISFSRQNQVISYFHMVNVNIEFQNIFELADLNGLNSIK